MTMKKICLFSTKAIEDIEGVETELYVNFYLVLNRNYIFTFLIDTPNISCTGRHPIKLWKHFLILLEEEYETLYFQAKSNKKPHSSQQEPHWIDNHNGTISCSHCQTWFHKDDRYYYMLYCPYCNVKMTESEVSK